MSPGPHAEQAENLRQEILAYADLVVHQPVGAVNQIDAWLDPVENWYQNSIDQRHNF